MPAKAYQPKVISFYLIIKNENEKKSPIDKICTQLDLDCLIIWKNAGFPSSKIHNIFMFVYFKMPHCTPSVMPVTSQQHDNIDGYAEDNMYAAGKCILLSCLASRFGWWSTENESYASSSSSLYSNLNSHSGMGALLNTYIMLINQKCFRYCTVNEQWMPFNARHWAARSGRLRLFTQDELFTLTLLLHILCMSGNIKTHNIQMKMKKKIQIK